MPELIPIQVGDHVRLTVRGESNRLLGRTGTVMKIDFDYNYPYSIQLDGEVGLHLLRYDKRVQHFEKI